jgi:hypothetical protein
MLRFGEAQLDFSSIVLRGGVTSKAGGINFANMLGLGG